jgi:hypothetical protein
LEGPPKDLASEHSLREQASCFYGKNWLGQAQAFLILEAARLNFLTSALKKSIASRTPAAPLTTISQGPLLLKSRGNTPRRRESKKPNVQ